MLDLRKTVMAFITGSSNDRRCPPEKVGTTAAIGGFNVPNPSF